MERFIDTSFDKELDETKVFKWLPWIGKDFINTKVKTLILGESTYNGGQGHSERSKVQESLAENTHLRKIHTNNAIDFNGKSLYARNIEKAIFKNKKTNKSEAHRLWTSVCYHNLVLRPMSSVKERPSYEDYHYGWKAFLKFMQVIPVDQCLVYGLEGKKIKSLVGVCKENGIKYTYQKLKPGVGRSYAKVISFEYENNEIKILFIRHPSSFFSWARWGPVILGELDLKGL